jgi:hypothetical protein
MDFIEGELCQFDLLSFAMANAASQDHLENNRWRSAHIWVNGVEKCRAFNRLLEQTRRLQASGGGTLRFLPKSSPSRRSSTNSRRYPNRRRSAANACRRSRNAVSGGRQDR